MKNGALPDMYVLDALANDVEDLESILRMLNSDTDLGWHEEWGRSFTRADVVAALSRLIRQDFVQVFVWEEETKGVKKIARRAIPPASYDNVYFGMTKRGRIVHSNWDPETHS
jgi:hypothetical protein